VYKRSKRYTLPENQQVQIQDEQKGNMLPYRPKQQPLNGKTALKQTMVKRGTKN